MRKPALLLSFACLVLVCALITSCGSGNSGGGENCSGPAVDVVGDWNLDVSGSGGSASGPGVIDSSGLAVFVQTSTSSPAPGDTVVFPTITGGSKCFSGTATAYATPASGGGSASQSVQGTINSSTSITGSLSNGNNFSLTSGSPLTGSVTALSGSDWQGEVEGATQPIIWDITLTPTGTGNSMNFTGTNLACNISGTFNQEGSSTANLNVFDVTVTSAEGCPFDNFTGIGFESSTDYFGMNGGAAGTYLYAVSAVNGAVALEIFEPAP